MDEKLFQRKLAEMLDEIKGLDVDNSTKRSLEEQANKAKQQFAKGKETVHRLAECIDALRVHVKYLVFDLEATKRENETLRDMLHSRGIDPDES